MKMLYCLLLIYPFVLNAQPAKPVFVADSLDIYVNRSLKDWNLPGCAVAIIKDGHIVLTKGYGLRDVEKNLPVDEHSLFMIASNSKAVTGLSLAKLEQEKKLSLDDIQACINRLVDYLPKVVEAEGRMQKKILKV